MPGDDGPLAGSQRGLQNGVEIGRQVAEAVVAARRNAAAAVPAVVVGDDPVVAGQVGDLLAPDLQGAGDAVRQDDRVAVGRAEDLGVQAGAVGAADDHRVAGWQLRGHGRVLSSGRDNVDACQTRIATMNGNASGPGGPAGDFGKTRRSHPGGHNVDFGSELPAQGGRLSGPAEHALVMYDVADADGAIHVST